MKNRALERETKVVFNGTAREREYLNSMMPETRQEGYTCVSGCQDCVSCDGNDYSLQRR